MAVTYVDSTTTGVLAFTTSRAPAVPVGAAADDVVVVHLSRWETTNPAVTSPAGFVHLTQVVNGSQKIDTYLKRLTAADTGTYSFSWTGSMWTTAHAILYRGVHRTVDLTTLPLNQVTNASGTAWPSATLNGVGEGSALDWHAYSETAGTHTPPTNWTEVEDDDSDTSAYWQSVAAGNYSTSGGASPGGPNTVSLLELTAEPVGFVQGRVSNSLHPGRTPGRGTRFRIDVTQRMSYADIAAAIIAQAGSAVAGASAQATQVKVAAVAATCSAAPASTGQGVKVTAEAATATAAPTATAVRANSKAETGTAVAAGSATARATKVAVQRGVCAAASSMQGAARKTTAQAGVIAAAAADAGRAVKVAPAGAQVAAAETVQAKAVKKAPIAAQVQAAATVGAAHRKVTAAGAQVNTVGFTYWSQVVVPRAVYGVCSAGGVPLGRATRIALGSGLSYSGAVTRANVAKRVTSSGTAAAGATCKGALSKRIAARATSSAAGACQAAVIKKAAPVGAAYAAGSTEGQRRALSPWTPRPDTGTTARPLGSPPTTVRPDSGTTPRPVILT